MNSDFFNSAALQRTLGLSCDGAKAIGIAVPEVTQTLNKHMRKAHNFRGISP
jgi:predicted small metal-binding protein